MKTHINRSGCVNHLMMLVLLIVLLVLGILKLMHRI